LILYEKSKEISLKADNKLERMKQDKLVDFTAYKRASLIYVTAKKEKGFSMKDSMASQNVDFEETKKLVISKKIDSMEKGLDKQGKILEKIEKERPDLSQKLKETLDNKKNELQEIKKTQGFSRN